MRREIKPNCHRWGERKLFLCQKLVLGVTFLSQISLIGLDNCMNTDCFFSGRLLLLQMSKDGIAGIWKKSNKYQVSFCAPKILIFLSSWALFSPILCKILHRVIMKSLHRERPFCWPFSAFAGVTRCNFLLLRYTSALR